MTHHQDREREWTTDSVRTEFCDYFASRGHAFVPSSPCVPRDDPTLLFVNAGMNQFKGIFLDRIPPGSPLRNLRRAANYQKCVRAGGKHNDLEDVGRDTYHHTFFEMLGSWSFGDYFKEDAVEMAFDLLVNVFGLDQERLYATYFEGDGDIEPDLEARDNWLKFLPKERVLGCGPKDNFWEMGDSGPCGPCSEIHYDRVGNRDASSLVNCDDPDVIEVWNLVFVQFERKGPSSPLTPLRQKHIDTGMGLERLVSILQGKTSNYDIDSFEPLLGAISRESKVGPYTGKVGPYDAGMKDAAYRVVADHARTLCFSIADGAAPDKRGAGYVLRRIVRRGMRYGRQILGAGPGIFARLVPVVVQVYGPSYPELRTSESKIIEVVTKEEKAFSKMLTRGIKYFKKVQSELASEGGKEISGEKVFFLYDSLGFPLDLTQVMASDVGLSVDVDGFRKEMQKQKERSRRGRKSPDRTD